MCIRDLPALTHIFVLYSTGKKRILIKSSRLVNTVCCIKNKLKVFSSTPGTDEFKPKLILSNEFNLNSFTQSVIILGCSLQFT